MRRLAVQTHNDVMNLPIVAALAAKLPYLAARRFTSACRLLWLSVVFPGFRFSGSVYIGPGCDIYVQRGGAIHLRDCQVSRGVTLTAGRQAVIRMNGVYLGQYSTIVARKAIEIDSGTKVAERVTIRDANHDHSVPLREGLFTSSAVSIDRDVWLGANSVVLAGVRVGEGATVGAGAVVTRDVAPAATVVGIPARPIRH